MIPELAHDVGKYVARIARNLPATGPVPPALARMLEADLYSLSGGERASAVFARLSRIPPAAPASVGPPAAPATRAASTPSGPEMSSRVTNVFAEVTTHFAEIDALEERVRKGDEVAQRRAAALAILISDALGSLL